MPRHATPSDIPPPATAFVAADYANDRKTHLLIAATGSVASIKIPLILQNFAEHKDKLSVRLVLTNASLLFLPPLTELLPHVEGIHLSTHEWPSTLTSESVATVAVSDELERQQEPGSIWKKVGNPILHIELRRWAQFLLISPLSANTLARISHGFADDLLTSIVRAWDVTRKIAVAPAMNTMMWDHPITGMQIKVLEGWEWVKVLRPVEKLLACGDSGNGAMMEWSHIVRYVAEQLGLESDGKKVEKEIKKEVEKEVKRKVKTDGQEKGAMWEEKLMEDKPPAPPPKDGVDD